MKFYYSVVRFVPYPLRGEFINVAVIGGSDESGEWAVKRVENPTHALKLGWDKARLGAVWRYLDSVEKRIRLNSEAPGQPTAEADISCSWLEEEYGYHRNIVQLTSPVPLAADTVQEAIDAMFSLFVVDPDKVERHTRTAAVAALRNALRNVGLPPASLHEKVTATVGRQKENIDFAVANGNLVQLAHAWEFRPSNPHATVDRIKAWSWTVRDLRENGGRVFTKDRSQDYPVDRDVEIGVTYSEPDTDDGRRSLEEAQEVFDHLHVRAVSTADAHIVAEDAVQALARSHRGSET